MKVIGRISALILVMVMMLSSIAFASNLTLMPPTDSLKYKPLGARNTTVYVASSKNTYMACKVNIDSNEIDSAYLFINQNLAYTDKFEENNLSKAVKIDKKYIIENYVVFNMKDYRTILESSIPNRLVVAVKKTDGTIEFSNIVLIVIASGEMTVNAQNTGNKVVYSITEGFLPIDPSTIVVTANGENIPFYYNSYDRTVTTFVTSGKNNIKFEVSDLKGAKALIQDTYAVSDILSGAGNALTRIQLASLISDVKEFALPEQVTAFKDIDFIPYDMRLTISSLYNNGILGEYSDQNMFKPNDPATQQMMADSVNKIAGRSLYLPTNPKAAVTLADAIKVVLSTLAE